MFSRFGRLTTRRGLIGSTLAVSATTLYALNRSDDREANEIDPQSLYYRNTLRLEQPNPVGSDTDRLSSTWTPPTRTEMLNDLKSTEKEQFDLLVVGGGATGAGIAVDAASRGLRVALVERDDFSSGKSPPLCSIHLQAPSSHHRHSQPPPLCRKTSTPSAISPCGELAATIFETRYTLNGFLPISCSLTLQQPPLLGYCY